MTTTQCQTHLTANNSFAGLYRSVATLLNKIALTEDDRREEYLAQSIDHADFDARERALEQHAVRNRAMFHLL